MAEGPTSFNGPLHTKDATVSDRQITAYFADLQQAHSVRDALVQANIPAAQVMVTDMNGEGRYLQPADPSIIGKIRETLLPDDGQRATRDAVAKSDVMLVVVPNTEDVDQIVSIIQAGKPHHFDADLERWRNSPTT